jgi:glycosyltransferase involved in cell wall biosynthesis
MKILFIISKFAWPLRTGSSVHAGNIMKAMVRLGHDVTLATEERLEDNDAWNWLKGVSVQAIADFQATSSRTWSLSYLQKRASNYAGCSQTQMDRWNRFITEFNPNAVVAVGTPTLPYLANLPNSIVRCWYIADDPMLAMWCRTENISVRDIVSKLAYQRIFKGSVDSVWVVSDRDRIWSLCSGGWKDVATIPNGVDAEFFSSAEFDPRIATKQVSQLDNYPRCGFWGNLSFPPNLDALEFFIRNQWKMISQTNPASELWVAGVHAPASLVQLMQQSPGVRFLGEVDSIVSAFAEVPIAVFPFRSGAGIKNKVLEAAAMGKTLLISSIAANGLRGDFQNSIRVIPKDDQWADELLQLFDDPERGRKLGELARRWVLEFHSWDASAQLALQAISKWVSKGP